MHRERHQAHADRRIETLHCLHQADVAFLDQIGQLQAVAIVAAGDMHDETQVRQHQLARGVQVVFFEEAACERLLVLDGEHRNLVDGANIGLERTE